jgi:hypothetical protein
MRVFCLLCRNYIHTSHLLFKITVFIRYQSHTSSLKFVYLYLLWTVFLMYNFTPCFVLYHRQRESRPSGHDYRKFLNTSEI